MKPLITMVVLLMLAGVAFSQMQILEGNNTAPQNVSINSSQNISVNASINASLNSSQNVSFNASQNASLSILVDLSQQSEDRFSSVSGDFARAWLKNNLDQPAASSAPQDNDLWSWGGTPKGKEVANGVLIDNKTTYVDDNPEWLGLTYQQVPANEDKGQSGIPLLI